MKIETTHFGPQEIDEKQIITFQEGLIDFENRTRFTLLPEVADKPVFYFLQAVDDPAVAFTVAFATQFGISYDSSILTPEDVEAIGPLDENDMVVLLLISPNPDDPRRRAFDPRQVPHITSPLVINAATRKGLQKILRGIRCSANISAASDTDPATDNGFEDYQRFLSMLQAAVPLPAE